MARLHKAKAEAVALETVFFSIVLQVEPEVVRKRKFGVDSLGCMVKKTAFIPRQFWFCFIGAVQNFSQLVFAFFRQWQGVKIKRNRFTEAQNQNPLAVLRHKVGAIYNAVMDVVAELFH